MLALGGPTGVCGTIRCFCPPKKEDDDEEGDFNLPVEQSAPGAQKVVPLPAVSNTLVVPLQPGDLGADETELNGVTLRDMMEGDVETLVSQPNAMFQQAELRGEATHMMEHLIEEEKADEMKKAADIEAMRQRDREHMMQRRMKRKASLGEGQTQSISQVQAQPSTTYVQPFSM